MQNQLSLEFDKADSVKVLDSNDAIAVYREANRRGLRVRIPRRITGMELLAQSHELKSRYYREFVAPLYAKTTRVKDEAESPDSDPEQWDVDLYRMKGPIPKSAKERQNRFEYLWVRVGNMFLDASRLPKTRLQRRAVFDALHLATALKLYRLEHGASPVAMKDLIPQYLPAPVYAPYKPGANETFHYNGIFYSVGPDREDNHAETRWDMWVSYPRRSDIFFASSSVLTTPAAESQSQPIR
ncbi:hypothetical protein HY256_02455 [Candidatus Sumerlaeota bacterium]|nr:hypothetical protein [Candidatus Sumerlaeota bacterium]